MCGRKWAIDPVGEMVMAEVTMDILMDIDRTWPQTRPASDLTLGWRWREIANGQVEVFALLDAGGAAAAIWCSHRKRPLVLPDGPHYRLDYLEVRPKDRKTAIGGLVFGIIAERALELGSVGLVLGTWDTHVRYYKSLGGRQELALGWTVPNGLLPFCFDQAALQRLREMADAFASK